MKGGVGTAPRTNRRYGQSLGAVDATVLESFGLPDFVLTDVRIYAQGFHPMPCAKAGFRALDLRCYSVVFAGSACAICFRAPMLGACSREARV